MSRIGFVITAIGAMMADSDSLLIPTIAMFMGLSLMIIGTRKEGR